MAASGDGIALDDVDVSTDTSRTSNSFTGSVFGTSRVSSSSEGEEEDEKSRPRTRRARGDPKHKVQQNRERVSRWREKQRTTLKAAEAANSELIQLNDELRTRLQESEDRRGKLASLVRRLTSENEQLREWKEAHSGGTPH